MKRLILLRHAKAERRAESGEDFDRALTADGRVAAAQTGRALALAGLIPDVALVSAALRTRQTFEALAELMPDVHLQTRRDLYNATREQLHEAVMAADADCVLVVAHNPGVQALAASLAQRCAAIAVDDRALVEQDFPTATAAAFEFAGGRTACLGVFRSAGAQA